MSRLLDSALPPIAFDAIPGLEVIEPTGPLQELVMSTDWKRLYEAFDDVGQYATKHMAELV